MQENLKDQLLMTLSFYEAMSMEFIYLDLDEQFLKDNPKLTIEDLQKALNELVKSKKVKKLVENKQEKWIRIYPKKSLLSRLKGLIS